MLAETDGLDMPLRTITAECAIDALPAPFGQPALSQTRLAIGMPGNNAAFGLCMQGAPGILHSRVSGRLQWQPRADYRLAPQVSAEWYSIDAFPDQWSMSVNLAAEMTIAEWRIAAGLYDMLAMGREAQPQMMLGLVGHFTTGSIGLELASSWNASSRCTISGELILADSITVALSLSASPISMHTAVRFPLTTDAQMVLAILHREHLGMQPRVSLCWQSPFVSR